MNQSRPIDLMRDQHEPTRSCADMHCYSCMVDEPGTGYIVCGECGHVFRTARELRRLHRRGLWKAHRSIDGVIAGVPVDMPAVPLWRVAWRLAMVRAKNIYFCPHCIHDF